MRSGLVALLAVALGCSSNDFSITETPDTAADTGAASDALVATDTSTPPPDGVSPVEDTSTSSKDSGVPLVDATATCAYTGDCPANHYCAFTACAKVGVCKTLSPMPGPYFEPVCGCDGTTYWNAQHAWMSSAPISHDGACGNAERKTCANLGGMCDTPDSLCVVERPAYSSCSLAVAGGCWRLPSGPSCGMGAGGSVLPCTGSTCMTYCKAVLSKQAFYGASCAPL